MNEKRINHTKQQTFPPIYNYILKGCVFPLLLISVNRFRQLLAVGVFQIFPLL